MPATSYIGSDGFERNVSPASPLPVNGTQVTTAVGFTRPADTTAYAAQDVVSNSTSAPALLVFSNAARALGGSGLILSARHMKNSTTTAGASYRLMLYSHNIVTPINDNAQFTMLFANRATRIGFIDFTHLAGGTGSDATGALSTFLNLPFVCNAAHSSLWGILTVTSAYTPTSAEQHYIELSIVQN